MKPFEEILWESIEGIDLGKDCLDKTPKAQAAKVKMNK